MSPRLRRAAGIAGAAAILALLGWRLWPRSEATAAAAAPAAAPDGSVQLAPSQVQGLGIALAPVRRADRVPVTGLPAQTEAPLEASQQVASPWAGTVSALLVHEGEQVRAGQPVLRLRSQDALRAGTELARAGSEAEVASRQARRDAQLLAEGIIPAARSEQSQAQARAAQAELARARDALGGVRVRLADGGEIELLAPIAGKVLRRMVRPGDALPAQAPALLIADPARLDIGFTVAAGLRAQLAPGLRVALADGSAARVAAIGADLDPASQQVPVRARFEDPAGHVPGERFAVTLLLPAPADALAIPAQALLPDGERHVAYARDGDRFRAVRIPRVLGNDGVHAVVQAPALRPGMDVVTRGTVALKALLPAPAGAPAGGSAQ
ncbi:MAG: efflux RND transporter periplasmic adaptor subunit [Stenotrophomonas sp.]|nr:efflux RND transporter periplasmic adaptor subunit [Xanthomonadales bacterium]MBN8768283.1 efflux RND transporter periplasmic adaptor subunit [Stenotrophomonas sp.]